MAKVVNSHIIDCLRGRGPTLILVFDDGSVQCMLEENLKVQQDKIKRGERYTAYIYKTEIFAFQIPDELRQCNEFCNLTRMQ